MITKLSTETVYDVGTNTYDYITFYGDYAGVTAINSAIEQDYQTYLNDMKEIYEFDDGAVSIDHYNYNITINSVYINDNIVSVYYYCDIYGGGAHGSYNYYSKTFDKNTGRLMSLNDVASEYSDAELKSMLCDAIDTYFEENPDRLSSNEKETAKEIVNGSTSTMDYCINHYGGISIIFNVYSISSYAAGYFIIDVPSLTVPE